jgi:hypothetical protein
MKHNKKRNTAFLYESLIKELTKAIVRKDNIKKDITISILKEYFSKNSILKKDLDLYRSILENRDSMTQDFSSEFLKETKRDFKKLNRGDVFNSQTKLINTINKRLSGDVFRNFIPNYKNIATVGQWFSGTGLNAKSRVLIETKVSSILKPFKKHDKDMAHIDNLTYSTFVQKFNETYKRSLTGEQKKLLTNYITSFSDNGLGLKVFMNEEIGRLKGILSEKKDTLKEQRKSDTKKVINKLEEFSNRPIDEKMVESLFYIQDLVREISNGH